MSVSRSVLIWAALISVISIPFAAAANSPLLAWREPIYIIAGFAGVLGLVALLLQPLLAAGVLPGAAEQRGRRYHRWVGATLIIAIIVHVAGLWITSPPDVIDALTFKSPTPFSAWGVVAMWGAFATAMLAVFRRRIHLRPLLWRVFHLTLAVLITVSTTVHAILIDGTMEWVSKSVLCLVVLLVCVWIIATRLRRPKRQQT